MGNARDLGQKINSLRNMQKVMGAMNMIATVKLRKLSPLQDSLRIFDRNLDQIHEQIMAAMGDSTHPLLNSSRAIKRNHVVIFTADKGLCGSHNNSITKSLDILIARNQTGAIGCDLSCIGTKGANYARRKNYQIYHARESNDRVFDRASLGELAARLAERIISGEIQEIHVIYNFFSSTLFQETRTMQILPFKKEGHIPKTSPLATVNMEPAGDAFLPEAARLFIQYKLLAAYTHSILSEHASRMTAMENATNNSQELINRYTLLRNRARQSTITNELIEIVSGKEALKG